MSETALSPLCAGCSIGSDMADRIILHCDCNAFYASVECLLHPEYRDVPMAVCGDPNSRHGVVLAKNEAAKRYGVQTAETIWQARRKCPGLVLAPPHREEYVRYSRLVNEIYLRYTDQVEPFSIDESWLDVTGSGLLFGSGPEIADELRRVVEEETGLTISVGVSFNKTFAKLGSDYKKPNATTVLSRETWQSLLYPLPVERFLFVGDSAAQKLRQTGIHTIGDLANARRERLVSLFGKNGGELWDMANGLDEAPVRRFGEAREVKSVGNGMTFRRDLAGSEDISLAVSVLADSTAARMRRHHIKCTTVQVTIRSPNFHTITRQKRLPLPTFLAADIRAAALDLIRASWNERAPIRMLTVTGSGIVPEDATGEQLSLFEAGSTAKREKQEHLEAALNQIRDKFGRDSLSIGSVLHNDLGIGKYGNQKNE